MITEHHWIQGIRSWNKMFHFFKLQYKYSWILLHHLSIVYIDYTFIHLIASETQTACITKKINLFVELRFFNHDNRDFAQDEMMFSYAISKKILVLFDAEECYLHNYAFNQIKSNLSYYVCCISPKHVTSWRGPSLRHCVCSNTARFEKTLCPILPAPDLNLLPPAWAMTNVLPLDQLTGWYDRAK